MESLAVRSLLRRPILTVERERELLRARRARSDEGARQRALSALSESHSKLVIALARQYQLAGRSMAELVAAGHIGLRAAIDSFDCDQDDARLGAFAVDWIHQSIQEHIRRHALPDRQSVLHRHQQSHRATDAVSAKPRHPSQREDIEATGAAARDDSVVQSLHDATLRRRVAGLAQEILGERERIVFLARCIGESQGVRQREDLATELGVTSERVYQLEVSARRKIAAALEHDGLLHPFAARGKSRAGRPMRRPTETPA